MKDKIIRIKLKTFQELQKSFPPTEEESVSSYFDRVVKYLIN